MDQQGELVILNTVEKYYIQKDVWELVSPLPQKVMSPMSLTFRGNIIVFGGTNENKQKVRDIFMYDMK